MSEIDNNKTSENLGESTMPEGAPSPGEIPVPKPIEPDAGLPPSESTPPTGTSKPPEKDQVDVYVQGAKNLLGVSWAFLKKFMRAPMSSFDEPVNFSSAILFAAVQAIAFFILIRIILGQIISLIPFGFFFISPNWFMIFFMTIIGYAVYLFALLALSVLFGKTICKATIDLKELFSKTVAAHIPLTDSFLASIIFVVFGMALGSGFFMSLAIATIIIGGIASYILYAKATTSVFKTTIDKGFYTTLATYGVLIFIGMLIAF